LYARLKLLNLISKKNCENYSSWIKNQFFVKKYVMAIGTALNLKILVNKGLQQIIKQCGLELLISGR
jgi:hypothetical protein